MSKHPSPKADRLREQREQTAARGTRSLVDPRLAPSREEIKLIADRAAGIRVTLPPAGALPAGMKVVITAGDVPVTVSPGASETLVYGGGRAQGKTAKARSTPPEKRKGRR